MFTPPDDLDPDDVRAAIHDGWGFDAVGLEYQAVGFGSHHSLATGADGSRRFVTVDVLSAKRGGLDGLTRALDTAYRLRHDAGLRFVVSPERTTDGHLLRPIVGLHAVAIYAFVDGISLPSAPFGSVHNRRATA